MSTLELLELPPIALFPIVISSSKNIYTAIQEELMHCAPYPGNDDSDVTHLSMPFHTHGAVYPKSCGLYLQSFDFLVVRSTSFNLGHAFLSL